MKQKSFWKTTTGLITAISGLISAIVALIGALYGTGSDRHRELVPPPGETTISLPVETPSCAGGDTAAEPTSESPTLGYPINDDDLISMDGTDDGTAKHWRFVCDALDKGQLRVFIDTVTDVGYFSVSVRSKEIQDGLPHINYVTRFIPKGGKTIWSFREAIKDDEGWKTRIDETFLSVVGQHDQMDEAEP